ncbi:sperm-tail PG-rich repeat-containing protein 2-like [Cydia fagiglandana]|uniref:sperm-tail PG-rich repeat-containing protein 2-like n=1 Tax=Cydia fagiglandana TaxID=1458189 RepID=UPI002FEE21F1
MAAYSLSERFSRDSKNYRIYDPGAYQHDERCKTKPAHAPFLTKTSRKTFSTRPIWTHAIYDADIPSKIPNCTSMMSKIPRFPYEAFSMEDLEEVLCKCGYPTCCRCPIEEEDKPKPNIVCQGKVPKHIIKGAPPRTGGDSGLSAPSKGDYGFEVRRDGFQTRLKEKVSDESPPFYDARVIETTMFYQGCKWSKWTGTRATKALEQSPGPADYTLEKKLTEFEKYAEKCRFLKRKEAKQYRYIEMVQRRNILENQPGPATYSPMLPKGTDLQEIGSKADRFTSPKHEVFPGPGDHNLKRDFDPPPKLVTPCHAVLPEPACFNVKAHRFKPRKEEGPGPASYCAKYKPYLIQTCSTAPFGSNTKRFRTIRLDETDETEIDVNYCDQLQAGKLEDIDPCPHHTWEFKSKTVRMKPLFKSWNEPSPADFMPMELKSKRPLHLQYLSPFCSSDGRFQPWYNFIPVYGKIATRGPGYYNAEKAKCYPAVKRGPLCRAPRFRTPSFETPAPCAYNVGGGIETILDTYNLKLKHNIENQYKFSGIAPERKVLTLKEKETLLMNQCIALCEEAINEVSSLPPPEKKYDTLTKHILDKKKILRFFLYKHQMPMPV